MGDTVIHGVKEIRESRLCSVRRWGNPRVFKSRHCRIFMRFDNVAEWLRCLPASYFFFFLKQARSAAQLHRAAPSLCPTQPGPVQPLRPLYLLPFTHLNLPALAPRHRGPHHAALVLRQLHPHGGRASAFAATRPCAWTARGSPPARQQTTPAAAPAAINAGSTAFAARPGPLCAVLSILESETSMLDRCNRRGTGRPAYGA